MKLYDIDSEIQAIYDEIEANEGVLPDELETALNVLQMERTKKIENIVKLLKNIDGDETKLFVEIQCLQKKLQSLRNRKQSVRNFLAYAIGEGNKVKTSVASIYWMNTKSTIADDVEKIPEQYLKITKEPKLTLIKAALESGEVIEGCHIVQNKSMVVK